MHQLIFKVCALLHHQLLIIDSLANPDVMMVFLLRPIKTHSSQDLPCVKFFFSILGQICLHMQTTLG